jgi:hypothetical protein
MLKHGPVTKSLEFFLMKQDAAATVTNARRVKELDYEV